MIEDRSRNESCTRTKYTYDQVGNRLSSLKVASHTYNNSNELTAAGSTTFTYDRNGNTLTKNSSSKGQTGYSWDFENRLMSVTLPNGGGVVTFRYDPFGRRIQRSGPSGTTIFAYDGANVTEELSSAGAPSMRYVQGAGIDEPLAESGTSVDYFAADGLGSITSLEDTTGTPQATFVYGAFGVLKSSTGSLTNSYRYTAREYDQDTGLYYYRARYYDSGIGRLISEDPIRFRSGPNFYSYVKNEPEDVVDPTGLYSIDNRIRQHLTIGWNLHCPAIAAGACTVDVASVLFCNCEQNSCDKLWKPSAILRIYGNMWVYNGPWSTLPIRPHDRSVHDSASAIAHENNVHINIGINAVKPALEQLESRTFSTQSECQSACAAAQDAIPKTFSDTVRRTQQEEEAGH